MGKVVGFGDLLVRLSPPGYQRFMQASSFDVNYTGAEANVLVSLGLNGVDTEFVTRLPDNIIAECAVALLKKYNVGVKHIAYGGERIGSYYLERGASQRPSRLVYDRKYTALATARPEDFDWDAIFEGASHFHFTGITPALGPELPQICLAACQAAHKRHITVSCDLNYRALLWDIETARRVMQELVQYVDVLIGNEEDSSKLLAVTPRDTDVARGTLDKDAYREVAQTLHKRYGFETVAFTLRQSISASDNGWSGMLYRNGTAHYSKSYNIHLVDRVGGGDSFAAGLLYAMLHGYDDQHAIEFAAAASCLKQTIEQDFNLSYADEIEKLASGDGSGRIQR